MIKYKKKFSNSVIVFDLDDTLYDEIDYRLSGFKEVLFYLRKYFGIKITNNFLLQTIKSKKNIIREIRLKAKLKKSIENSLLWIYRLHKPKIKLKKNIVNLLNDLKKSKGKILILTDGRSITQRLKLDSLGLKNYPFFISEDYSDKKPSFKRFKIIMKQFPAKFYIYIGDNVKKDFLAPNQLNWLTICIRGNKKKIYSKMNIRKKKYLPKFYVNKLSNLKKLNLCL